jgi:spore germination protein KB
MDNKKVPGAKISSLIAIHLIASSLALGDTGDAKQDSWIAMAAATGAAFLLVWLYSAVLRLHPGKNMFDIFVDVFGNIGGKIVCALYVIYTVYLGARIFSLYDNFIRIVNLDSTPIAAILLISVPLIAGLVKCGLKNMGSCAKFLIVIVFLMTAITVVLGARFMDLGNIKPILVASPKAMLSTVFAYLTLPLGEIVVGMSFFGEIDQKESPFRILSKGVLIGGIFLTVILLRNILLLGAPTCRLFLFASYDAVGIISVGDFVTRISVFIGVEQTLTGVVKLSSFGYSATQGVSKILGLKKFLQPAAPCCALMAALSLTLYSNILTELNFEKYVSLIAIPFQLIFPVVTLIVGRIRQGGRKKDAAKKAAPVKEAAPAPKEPAL